MRRRYLLFQDVLNFPTFLLLNEELMSIWKRYASLGLMLLKGQGWWIGIILSRPESNGLSLRRNKLHTTIYADFK